MRRSTRRRSTRRSIDVGCSPSTWRHILAPPRRSPTIGEARDDRRHPDVRRGRRDPATIGDTAGSCSACTTPVRSAVAEVVVISTVADADTASCGTFRAVGSPRRTVCGRDRVGRTDTRRRRIRALRRIARFRPATRDRRCESGACGDRRRRRRPRRVTARHRQGRLSTRTGRSSGRDRVCASLADRYGRSRSTSSRTLCHRRRAPGRTTRIPGTIRVVSGAPLDRPEDARGHRQRTGGVGLGRAAPSHVRSGRSLLALARRLRPVAGGQRLNVRAASSRRASGGEPLGELGEQDDLRVDE